MQINPMADPIPTIAASKGPKNIDKNIGTCAANVAENGGMYILKLTQIPRVLLLI